MFGFFSLYKNFASTLPLRNNQNILLTKKIHFFMGWILVLYSYFGYHTKHTFLFAVCGSVDRQATHTHTHKYIVDYCQW